jgi:hypothetical protein
MRAEVDPAGTPRQKPVGREPQAARGEASAACIATKEVTDLERTTAGPAPQLADDPCAVDDREIRCVRIG